MAEQYLEIVDAADVVVGRALRSVIHREGLLHREVHVFFSDRDGNLIFQRRSATKDTYPNFLDATAGGHVDPGQTYLEAALMEVREETGLSLVEADISPIGKIEIEQVEAGQKSHNHVFRMIYFYRFDGTAADLTVENGDGAGFVTVPLSDFLTFHADRPGEFVPGLFSAPYRHIWNLIEKQAA